MVLSRKNHICFYEKEIIIFCKKESNLFLCKVKKEWFYQEKIISVFRKKKEKKNILKWDSHSWSEFIMHASHIKILQLNFQSLL